ncbi:MAG: UDP-N-acetylglucosamine 2-epimerase (hydrolyzing) [Anaerolineae bacterium]|nr:UDP-N-acetylglucosamine 2-epimerase (hydrolyzing) [Anaerolineae bacterium]
MRTIGVVTVARSDYGIYLPVLNHIQIDPDLRLQLFVGGMHLSPEFGLTVHTIEHDGFSIAARVEMLLSSDTPEGIAKSVGLGTIGFAQAYTSMHPDILLVLGDRFDMYAAVIAALPFNIPIAHIHGGELTQGAIDDTIRHAITKMSHLHFVATETYARRIIQMGEQPWRVTVSGAPSLDNLRNIPISDRVTLQQRHAIDLQEPFLLVTYHPVTREPEQTEMYIQALLAALTQANMTVVFTYPNADTSGRVIIQIIKTFTKEYPKAYLVANLGTADYFSMMHYATAMVGNSSSGIIEAASFELPVVNIGTRQQGRLHAKNVIDVGYTQSEILSGIQKAISPTFRSTLRGMNNPYGDGHAAERIVATLKQIPLDSMLLSKSFYDLPL